MKMHLIEYDPMPRCSLYDQEIEKYDQEIENALDVDRRGFLKGGFGAIAATSMGVLGTAPKATAQHGQGYKLRLGADLPASHSIMRRLKEASDAIAMSTNGQVSIGLLSNNQIGS